MRHGKWCYLNLIGLPLTFEGIQTAPNRHFPSLMLHVWSLLSLAYIKTYFRKRLSHIILMFHLVPLLTFEWTPPKKVTKVCWNKTSRGHTWSIEEARCLISVWCIKSHLCFWLLHYLWFNQWCGSTDSSGRVWSFDNVVTILPNKGILEDFQRANHSCNFRVDHFKDCIYIYIYI